MKTLFVLVTFFFSDLALAGGRLLVKPVYEKYEGEDVGRWTYFLGLPVMEDIPYLPFRYEGYAGLTFNDDRQLDYVRSEQGVALATEVFIVGLSSTMDYYPRSHSVVNGVFGYLSVTLW
jgi:hypothetical protein